MVETKVFVEGTRVQVEGRVTEDVVVILSMTYARTEIFRPFLGTIPTRWGSRYKTSVLAWKETFRGKPFRMPLTRSQTTDIEDALSSAASFQKEDFSNDPEDPYTQDPFRSGIRFGRSPVVDHMVNG